MIHINLKDKLLNNSKWYVFPFLLLLLACPTEDDPPKESYDCIDNSCVDPGDGTGEYDTCPESCMSSEEFIQMGWADLSVGSYEDALNNFDEALSIDSLNVSASMGKAWCMFFMDSGSTLDSMKILFEKGVSDSTWSADAYCGLSIVTFAQGHYTTAIAYADLLLSIDPVYVLEFYTEIDYHDILLVKAQSQYFTQNYVDAYTTLTDGDIVDDSLDPDQEESWEVNGIQYPTFESALSAVIASVTSEYDSEGFISNP